MNEHSVDPLAAYRATNVGGTLRLARQACEAGVRRFVFVSSIKVNGERTAPGQSFQECDPVVLHDPYGRSKAEAESALRCLADDTGLEVSIVRPPLVYGPGVRANFLRMMRWIAERRPLPLGAVRHNSRTLVGVDNLVDLLLLCLSHPAAANRTFLVGDDESLSTAALIEQVAQSLGVSAVLLPVPVPLLRFGATLVGRDAQVNRLCDSLRVDSSLARNLLGWQPPLRIGDGLQRTADWFHSTTRLP